MMPVIHPDMGRNLREGYWCGAKAYFERAYDDQQREREFWQHYEAFMKTFAKKAFDTAKHELLRPPYVKER